MGLTTRVDLLIQATVAGPSNCLLAIFCVFVILRSIIVLLEVSFGLNSLCRDDCHNTSTLLAAAIVAPGTSEGRVVFIKFKYWLLVNKDVTESLFVVVAVVAETCLDSIDYFMIAEELLASLAKVVFFVTRLVKVFELFEVAVTSLCCSGQKNSRDNLMHRYVMCIQ